MAKNERIEYLKGLAEEYGVELRVVGELARFLGPDEDYDGLPAMLQDMPVASLVATNMREQSAEVVKARNRVHLVDKDDEYLL